MIFLVLLFVIVVHGFENRLYIAFMLFVSMVLYFLIWFCCCVLFAYWLYIVFMWFVCMACIVLLCCIVLYCVYIDCIKSIYNLSQTIQDNRNNSTIQTIRRNHIKSTYNLYIKAIQKQQKTIEQYTPHKQNT